MKMNVYKIPHSRSCIKQRSSSHKPTLKDFIIFLSDIPIYVGDIQIYVCCFIKPLNQSKMTGMARFDKLKKQPGAYRYRFININNGNVFYV